MANCLRAMARAGKPVIVTDRPNPIGGLRVEGPTLEPGFESFVGQFRMPMRHGMTIAELALYFNQWIGAELEVMTMEGWSRDMYWDDTDLPWVLPSPNVPTLDTRDRLSRARCWSKARCCRRGAGRPGRSS